jgi:hypothetical protein
MLNINTTLNQVRKLHENATKETVMNYKGNRYTFVFDRYYGTYSVTNSIGENIGNFNTRKILTAKKWVREYVDN